MSSRSPSGILERSSAAHGNDNADDQRCADQVAGKRLSFDVPTLPLFVHERLSTQAIIQTLSGHKRDQQMALFADPQHSITDQMLKAYEHRDKWVNRMILGDSLGANAGQTLQKPDAKTPIAYMLYQNYPNPFNPSTNIRYALTEDANVSLIVYDILGREVTTLVNNVEAAGYHTIVWNATRSASGVYFLRIRVTSGYGVTKYTKVTKLMVLK